MTDPVLTATYRAPVLVAILGRRDLEGPARVVVGPLGSPTEFVFGSYRALYWALALWTHFSALDGDDDE